MIKKLIKWFKEHYCLFIHPWAFIEWDENIKNYRCSICKRPL